MHEKNYSKYVRRLYKSKYYNVLIRNNSSKEFGYEVVTYDKQFKRLRHFNARTLEYAYVITLSFISDSWLAQYERDWNYV